VNLPVGDIADMRVVDAGRPTVLAIAHPSVVELSGNECLFHKKAPVNELHADLMLGV
jgi:hypothetical protein